MDGGEPGPATMLIEFIAPLLFSSVLITTTVETQQIQKGPLKDHTVIHSYPDDVLGRNCVAYVRSVRPDAPNINASDYPVSTTTPFVGAIGKQYFPRNRLWHVFIVLEVRGEMLLIQDGHYDDTYVTVRLIPKNNVVGYL